MTTSEYGAALVAALRRMPDEMAEAWGGDLTWVTSGTHVASLVRDWLDAAINDPSSGLCEDCGDPMPDGPSCDHDGHAYCDACYVERCGECKADLIDSMRSER